MPNENETDTTLTETAVGPAIPPLGGPEEGREASGQLPCEALTKAGRPCGRVVGSRRTADGTWKCRSHAGRAPGEASARPVAAIRSHRDVERLTEWVALQLADGKLENQQGAAIVAACREWRQARAEGREYAFLRASLDFMTAVIEDPEWQRTRPNYGERVVKVGEMWKAARVRLLAETGWTPVNMKPEQVQRDRGLGRT